MAHFNRTRLGIKATLSLALLIASCGGSDGAQKTAGPPSGSPVASATQGGLTPGPSTAPIINGKTYTFAQKGYSVVAPDGWTAQPNGSFDVAGARFPMDIFFTPDIINGIQPSVSVSCLKPRQDEATTAQFRDGWRAFLTQLIRTDVIPREVSVDGNAAYTFDYAQGQEIGTATIADKTDVVFVAGQCRWLITLLAPAGQRAKYRPVLDGVLKSFRTLT